MQLFCHTETYTNNLLVRRAGYEEMLFVFIWVEFGAVCHLPGSEPRYTLSSLRVPEFNVTVVS